MALAENLRKLLREPFGQVMQGNEVLAKLSKGKPKLLVAVGDETIRVLLQGSIMPDIAVFDLLCMRKPISDECRHLILSHSKGAVNVNSPPGTIGENLEHTLICALENGKGWIRIIGEDDLSALVIMANSKDGTVVLYGLPGKGMVWSEITPDLRERAKKLLLMVISNS